MRKFLKEIQETVLRKNQLESFFFARKNYLNKALFHLIITAATTPIVFYLGQYTDLPKVYLYLGYSYLFSLPIYTVICGVIPYFKDKFVYFFITHYFVITLIAFETLRASNFETNQLFFFYAVFGVGILIIQRWFPIILYNVFVTLLMIYGLIKTGDTAISKPLITLSFFLIGTTGVIVTSSRLYKLKTSKSYRDYLKQLITYVNAGYVLFDYSNEKIKIYDYNSQAIKTLHLEDNSIKTITSWLQNLLSAKESAIIKNLQQGKTFKKRKAFNKHNVKHFINVDFNVAYIKNKKFILANIIDVTAQVEKREELELSEKRYKNLYFKNKAGVFTVDEKSVILNGNNSFFEMFEKTLKVGDKLFTQNLQKDWELILETLGEKENSKNFQTLYKLNNGNEKSFVFSWYFDTQSKNIEGSVIDLTSIQQASKALMQSEEKYRLIYEGSNDAILLLENDKIVNINRKTIQLFGLPESQIIGMNLFDLSANINDVSREEYNAYIHKLNSVRSVKFNWLFAGNERTIESEVTLIEIMLENRLFYQCVIHDNTELNKNIRAIKSNQRNLEYILDNNPEGIMIIRGEEILYTNSEYNNILGINTHFTDLLDKKSTDKFNKIITDHLESKKRKTIQLHIKNKKGEKILLDITMVSTQYEEEEATLIILKDISVQNTLAKEKMRAELAEESNKKLAKEIKDRTYAEKLLEDQFLRTRAILESSTNTFLITLSLTNKITSYNTHCERYFKKYVNETIKKDELFDKYLVKNLPPVNFRLFKLYLEGAKKGKSRQFEVKLSTKSKEFWMEVFLNPIYDTEGKISEISMVAHDISEKKKTSIEIVESLREKEILLKEIHHRVKNNLQVISSILNLQSSFVQDENTLEILQESRNRIRSMAIIHENLYRTEDFSSINFSEYLENLSNNLISSYILDKKVVLDAQMEDVDLILDQAIPCGLLVNELITNSLKYAWEGKDSGKIKIRLSEKKGKVHLEISDDGKGLPNEFEKMKSDTLGLQLVITLVEQLDGDISVNIKNGTKYLIKFDNNKPTVNVKD